MLEAFDGLEEVNLDICGHGEVFWNCYKRILNKTKILNFMVC